MVKETDVKKMLPRLYNQEDTESGSPEGKSENGMSGRFEVYENPGRWSKDGK